MLSRASCRVLLGFPLLLGLGVFLLAQGGPPAATTQLSTKEFLQRKLTRKLEKLRRSPQPYMYPGEAHEFYVLKRVEPGKKALPVEKYLAALEHMRRMPRYSTPGGQRLPSLEQAELSGEVSAQALGTWTPLGPGNIGGRTRGLVIDPNFSVSNTMYAAGVAGGVWKTTDGGLNWTPLTDLIANLAVNSMAMHPGDSSVIYAGTGEGYFNGDQVRGAGIFKTTNGGTSWSHLANTNNSNFHYVNDLIVSHNNTSRVYAATRTGIWRSTDAGATWTQVFNQSGTIGGCLDLEIRRDQANDYLFASCGTFTQATVYRNIDAAGAGTWNSVLTETNMGRTHLAIAPSTPTTIYALSASLDSTGNFLHGLHAVFRSTSNGDAGTWTAQVRNTDPTKLNTVLLTNPLFAFFVECGFGSSNSFFNQGWYDNVIAVDPVNADIVWVGGIDLFRSDNGGVSWGLASYWWVSPSSAHADQHVIVFHPEYNGSSNQTMFVGNDGGLYRTNNARAAVATGPTAPCNSGNTSVAWTELNNNYGVTQFYHGLPYPTGTTYFGGTQDNGTIRGTDGGGAEAWTEILGGDGGYVAVDPGNTSILYAENTGISIQKSVNGGASFTDATAGITADTGLFITPFIMDPTSADRLWTGGNKMWRTDNAAGSWSQGSTDLTGARVSAITVAPTDSNRVLAGMSDGAINRTSSGTTANSGTVWSSTAPRAGFVSWVAFDPTNANVAYLTYSSFGGAHVFKSIDGGASWNPIDGTFPNNIPDIPVHSIAVDPNDTSRLYVGTDLGVFSSTDGGANWAVEDTGFAHVVVEALALGNVGATPNVFAFTHGRGAWRVPVSAAGSTLTIDDVTVTEGDAGTVNAVFTVTLNPTATSNVTVNFATADGSAMAGSDYNSTSGQITIAAGSSTQTLTVQVLGDTIDEPDETFFVNLSNASGAILTDSQGVGTITDDDAPPGTLTINDVTVTEGNAGTVNAVFTVTLNPTSGSDVSVNFATADDTATAGSDYQSSSGQITITAGNSTQTITVQVLGDTTDEPNETFLVNLSGASGATIGDSQGVGTITDDDVTPNATFTGKVKNAAKQAVAGATIGAYQSAVLKFSTTSDASGAYALAVTAGTYDLVASKPADGYLDSTRSGMAISSGQTLTKIKFKLFRPSFFQGTVTQKGTTTPIDGVLVEAIQNNVTIASDTTAPDGTYSLQVIKGTYTLRASKVGFNTVNKLDQVIGDGTNKTVNIAMKPQSAGATRTVNAQSDANNPTGYAFSPVNLTVNRNDTVRFTNVSAAPHNVVWDSPNSPPNTSVFNPNESVSVVMTNAGTFNYHCGIHGLAMNGTITVNP